MACGVTYHNIALENARKRQCVARLLELKPKSDLAAREEGQLENRGLGPVVIEPRSHLSHDGPQVCAWAANLNNVHARLPAERALALNLVGI
jgi:hypothetical protein